MKKACMVIALFLILFSTIPVSAEVPYPDELSIAIKELKANKLVPPSLPGIPLVTTEEASKLWNSEKVIFLDNRPKAAYEAGRIADAQWLFSDDLLNNPDLAKKLDKDKGYVLYCNGDHCWRSAGAALMLKNLGFKKLYWYRLGLPDWKKQNLPTVHN